MYIQNRPVAAIYRLFVGCLAAVAIWILFATFGDAAWRLFSTWVMISAACYFVVSAITTAFWGRRDSGEVIAPTFQGLCIVSGAVLAIGQLVFYMYDFQLESPAGWSAFLIDFFLPILMFIDWVLFSEKGKWRIAEPFYWLALPACYAGVMIFTSVIYTRTMNLRFPYEFLDYPEIGINGMVWWLVIIAVLILAFGYLMMILDFAVSGKLAEHIVMPRIKTIVIEEVSAPDQAAVEDEAEEDVIVAEKIVPAAKAKKQPAMDVVRPQPKKSKPKANPKSEKSAQKQSESKAAEVKETESDEQTTSETEIIEPKVTFTVDLEQATKISRKDEPKKAEKPKTSDSNQSETKPKTSPVTETVAPKDSTTKAKPEITGLHDSKSANNIHGAKSNNKKSRPVHASK